MLKSSRWGLLVLPLTLLVAGGLAREIHLISQSRPTSWEIDPKASCGVVLTGGPGRIRAGIELLYRRAIKKLIISGVNPTSTLREIFPNWPLYGGLNETDVILERRSTTTYGNAVQSRTIAEAIRCDGLILVTSALHGRRAERTFRAVLPDEIDVILYTVPAGTLRPSWYDVGLESLKGLFYGLWVF